MKMSSSSFVKFTTGLSICSNLRGMPIVIPSIVIFNGVKTYLWQYIDWLKRSSMMLAILAAFCFAPYGWIPFVLVMSIPTVSLIIMLYISWPRPNESIVTIEYEPNFRVGGKRKMWISVPRKYLNDRKAPIYRVSFPRHPTTMSSISLGDITDRMRDVLWS